MVNGKSPITYAERKRREAAIRYQVFTARVTTMGACAKECGRPARGGGECADCLAGTDPALRAFVRGAREQVLRLWDMEDAEECGRDVAP